MLMKEKKGERDGELPVWILFKYVFVVVGVGVGVHFRRTQQMQRNWKINIPASTRLN